MSANRVAVRYAKAFVGALVEKDAVKDAASFIEFCDMVASNDELKRLFSNVTVAAIQKENVARAIAEKMALPALTVNFLGVLASGGRIGILAEMRAAVAAKLDELSNTQTVELVTATAASNEDVSQFAASMKAKLGSEVRVTPRTDESIIGGAIARVGSTVFDGSVRAQLDRLRAELVKEN